MTLDLSAGWEPPRPLVDSVREAASSRAGEAWSLLEELVGIDSSPDNVDGLERVIAVIRPRLDRLGLTTEIERTSDGHPVLHARREVGDALNVVMVGHLDTVFEAGTVSTWAFARDGQRVTGPGIADAKGGAAVIWLALAASLEATDGLPGINLHVILNTDEEAGSVQSRPIFERDAQQSDLALIYEPGRPDGSIVRQRRGARRYRIVIRGKAAHTGVEPWAGVNAVEAAAHKILALHELNDRERFLSVTVATARGGTRINVVPDEMVLEVDTRLPDDETAAATHRAVEEIVAREDLAGSDASYAIVSDRPPLMPQAGVPALLSRFRVAGQALGLNIQDTATGGGSDGCFISMHGVPTIDALGPVGGGYHTRDEFIHESTLEERAMVSALFLGGLTPAEK